MTFFRTTLSALMLAMLSLTWSQNVLTAAPVSQTANVSQEMTLGLSYLQLKQPAAAIPHFDSVISSFEANFHDPATAYFSARTQKESIYYMMNAAKLTSGQKKRAEALSSEWAYAYFYKSYVLTELGRYPESLANLKKAIDLSPQNSQFISELAYLYQTQKNWTTALDLFNVSASAAMDYSPSDTRDAELSKALRGVGYVYVELGRLDEAEAMYRNCLEINPNDAAASDELRYVSGLKAGAGKK